MVRTVMTLAIALAWTGGLAAQGLLVDVRPNHPWRMPRPEPLPHGVEVGSLSGYTIDSLDVRVQLHGQIARVTTSQTFHNPGPAPLEVCFVFPLPYDGAIDQMTFMVDGKEYPAELLPADKARAIYESIVRQNKDPALLEWIGTGMFKTSVFPVPAGAKRTVTLRYAQVCRHLQGVTDFVFPLATAKYTSAPLRELRLELSLESDVDIRNIYSPTHPVQIERPDPRHAVVRWSQQSAIPETDFRLMYDVGDQPLAAKVISYRPTREDDGYFMLLAAPALPAANGERVAKSIVFVVDRSGSMAGKKIEQARAALRQVMNNLSAGDLFNIVVYDTEVETFRPEMQRFNDETRQAALGFIGGIDSGGSTNIDGALRRALELLPDSGRPSYLVFLTDGLPTAGETNEAKIVQNVRQLNRAHVRLFPFGVGFDVNSRLLDRLARVSFGQSEFVRPNEDIETYVGHLSKRIESPVLTNAQIDFQFAGNAVADGPPVRRVYPDGSFDLFAGEQLVVVGRYRRAGTAHVVVTGQLGKDRHTFEFPAEFVEHSPDSTHAFIAKLWATRRVGEIIDQIDLSGRNEELIAELIQLATQHGILTPYTSFLADDQHSPRGLAGQVEETRSRLNSLQEADGVDAFFAREAKAAFQYAPQALSVGGYGGYGGRPVDAETQATTTVRTIGPKTFFLRSGRWVDSQVDADKAKPVYTIQLYSNSYFDQLRKHGKELGQYLALEGPIVLKFAGEVWEFR